MWFRGFGLGSGLGFALGFGLGFGFGGVYRELRVLPVRRKIHVVHGLGFRDRALGYGLDERVRAQRPVFESAMGPKQNSFPLIIC